MNDGRVFRGPARGVRRQGQAEAGGGGRAGSGRGRGRGGGGGAATARAERIDGLEVHGGWSCNGGCVVVSADCDVIRRHCGRVHWLNVKAAGVVSRVTLQAFFHGNPR
jgi:hypothetical protein